MVSARGLFTSGPNNHLKGVDRDPRVRHTRERKWRHRLSCSVLLRPTMHCEMGLCCVYISYNCLFESGAMKGRAPASLAH